MTSRETVDVRTCVSQHRGSCTRIAPCLPCIGARSRAVQKVGPDFPALGFLAVQGYLENA